MEAAGRGDGELVFNGERVSVLQDRRCSGGWGHDSVNVLHTTELCAQNGSCDMYFTTIDKIVPCGPIFGSAGIGSSHPRSPLGRCWR